MEKERSGISKGKREGEGIGKERKKEKTLFLVNNHIEQKQKAIK